MSRLLHRLGHSTAAHPWRTISAWLVVAAARLRPRRRIRRHARRTTGTSPAPRPRPASRPLREHTPGAGNASARVVVHTRTGLPSSATTIAPLTERLAAMDHVVAVSPPRMSEDRDTALLTVQYDAPVTHDDLMANLAPLEKAVAPDPRRRHPGRARRRPAGHRGRPDEGQGELIGIAVALLILVLAFGSVVGAGLPVAVALIGLGGRVGRHHPAGRRDGREHLGPDGRHDGRAGRRHRLRPAAGHPARGVPPRRATTSARPRVVRSPRPVARWSSPPRPCWSRCSA